MFIWSHFLKVMCGLFSWLFILNTMFSVRHYHFRKTSTEHYAVQNRMLAASCDQKENSTKKNNTNHNFWGLRKCRPGSPDSSPGQKPVRYPIFLIRMKSILDARTDLPYLSWRLWSTNLTHSLQVPRATSVGVCHSSMVAIRHRQYKANRESSEACHPVYTEIQWRLSEQAAEIGDFTFII